MSRRQLADEEGHRWDVADEGPLEDGGNGDTEDATHRLRFTRDDGSERVREAPFSLDQMADTELRALLAGGDVAEAGKGPDLEANRSGGYGEARA